MTTSSIHLSDQKNVDLPFPNFCLIPIRSSFLPKMILLHPYDGLLPSIALRKSQLSKYMLLRNLDNLGAHEAFQSLFTKCCLIKALNIFEPHSHLSLRKIEFLPIHPMNLIFSFLEFHQKSDIALVIFEQVVLVSLKQDMTYTGRDIATDFNNISFPP